MKPSGPQRPGCGATPGRATGALGTRGSFMPGQSCPHITCLVQRPPGCPDTSATAEQRSWTGMGPRRARQKRRGLQRRSETWPAGSPHHSQQSRRGKQAPPGGNPEPTFTFYAPSLS